MPVMAWCKKCKQEVTPGSVCPLCGQKLPSTSLRFSWTFGLVPVRDFLSWNSILRVALPVLALLMLVILGVEWARKGFLGVQALLTQGLPAMMLWVGAALLAIAFLGLLLRGREEIQYVLNHAGVQAKVTITKPNRLQRLFHDPAAPAQADDWGQPVWLAAAKDIPWQAVHRVELWPDRDKILLYSPRFWLVLTLHALPETYDDAVRYVYDHVKKRPGVMKMVPPPGELPPPQL